MNTNKKPSPSINDELSDGLLQKFRKNPTAGAWICTFLAMLVCGVTVGAVSLVPSLHSKPWIMMPIAGVMIVVAGALLLLPFYLSSSDT